MKKIFSSFLRVALIFLLLTPDAWAQKTARKVKVPKKIDYEGKTFHYDPAWQNKEVYLEANLDEDEDKEIIIAFMGRFKPEKENSHETPEPFTRNKKEIIIIQHQAFYQIYDKGFDGYYTLVKMLTGMEQPGRIELIKLDEEHPPALAIYSPGGRNYQDLSIYLWQKGGYRLVFNHAGTQNFSIDALNHPVAIIGKQDNDPEDKMIATWDETTDSFIRSRPQNRSPKGCE